LISFQGSYALGSSWVLIDIIARKSFFLLGSSVSVLSYIKALFGRYEQLVKT
jgi:hypothetical protein